MLHILADAYKYDNHFVPLNYIMTELIKSNHKQSTILSNNTDRNTF